MVEPLRIPAPDAREDLLALEIFDRALWMEIMDWRAVKGLTSIGPEMVEVTRFFCLDFIRKNKANAQRPSGSKTATATTPGLILLSDSGAAVDAAACAAPSFSGVGAGGAACSGGGAVYGFAACPAGLSLPILAGFGGGAVDAIFFCSSADICGRGFSSPFAGAPGAGGPDGGDRECGCADGGILALIDEVWP